MKELNLRKLEKGLNSLTKELNSLILEKIDSQVKNLNSLILEEINSLAKARYCQIITKLLTREELNSPILKEKIKALKNKELDSLMKKRKSWIRELNSQTEKINLWIKKQKIKINPQTKKIQMEEIC